ncbi:hypothetical protein N7468_009317 [Penicillium chermesinum]|uniref:Uncharacterized protein n=1 Tax=Penicillium chermesinum TaxID=63820 RepID=A0A9W9TEW6_9EURO|nr:uncharacterized protein N7468_009317 [Penicillium chermesinum]KAJ5220113.1 hypothetical protein N7468_009317 [Penicillium chermesinum]
METRTGCAGNYYTWFISPGSAAGRITDRRGFKRQVEPPWIAGPSGVPLLVTTRPRLSWGAVAKYKLRWG